jgi:hypothetical protein
MRADYELPIANFQLPTADCRLPIADSRLTTTNRQLPSNLLTVPAHTIDLLSYLLGFVFMRGIAWFPVVALFMKLEITLTGTLPVEMMAFRKIMGIVDAVNVVVLRLTLMADYRMKKKFHRRILT